MFVAQLVDDLKNKKSLILCEQEKILSHKGNNCYNNYNICGKIDTCNTQIGLNQVQVNFKNFLYLYIT